MASQATGLTAASRGGCLAWIGSSRRPEPPRKANPNQAQEQDRPREAAPPSWLARHLALWSRTTQSLRVLDAPRARVTVRDASWPLPRDLTSVRRARRLVTGQLGEWAVEDAADTAELLVSEVVTNALRYTRGPLRLNLQVRDFRLRCEVEDTEADGPVRHVVDTDAEGGRGTELLDVLAEAWGNLPTAIGKTIWFELITKVAAPVGSIAANLIP
ncbi:ATP-binding protein [Streptomyces sp. NPDC051453]|uniref:ATP-binding protein n=1 Tax=Streptomyces sp. NPDC051453 TaxID=3154941 RepID=UPI00342385EB